MGMYCEIVVNKTSNDVFTPGSVVSGIIRYAVDEEITCQGINVFLKGIGSLDATEKRGEDKKYYSKKETYVDLDTSLLNSNKGLSVIAIGQYKVPFSFILPPGIPSSLDYSYNGLNYEIRCKIDYNVVIKFAVPGFFRFTQTFVRKLTVLSEITPKLLMEPVIYGERKKLTNFFRKDNSIVNIKTCIKKSVLYQGEKVQLTCEVQNETNKDIKALQAKLTELYTFYPYVGREIKIEKDVKGTEKQTSSIKGGDTVETSFDIDVPVGLQSLEYSKIVSRSYFVVITAQLPMPHIDVTLKIPIQVGGTPGNIKNSLTGSQHDSVAELPLDPPPSYWEVMSECNNANDACRNTSLNVDYGHSSKK